MSTVNVKKLQKEFFDSVETASGLQRIFDRQSDIHFFVKNRDHQFMAANHHFVHSKGYLKESEIIGKTSYDIGPPELAKMYHEDDDRVLESGEDLVDRMEVIISTSGESKWICTTKFPLYDREGNIIGVAVTARDLKKYEGSVRSLSCFDEVIKYIHKNYHKKLSVEKLASIANMSTRTFERRFKKTFGTTPIQYIIRYRINKACEILRNENCIFAELAQRTGFYDQSSFTKAFIKAVGMRPKDYRNKHR